MFSSQVKKKEKSKRARKIHFNNIFYVTPISQILFQHVVNLKQLVMRYFTFFFSYFILKIHFHVLNGHMELVAVALDSCLRSFTQLVAANAI